MIMKRWTLIVGVSAITVFCVLAFQQVKAETIPSWFSDDAPNIIRVEQNVSPPKLSYWGAPCRDQTFNAFWMSSGSEVAQEVTSCVHQAPYGYMGNYGVKISGTDVSYGFRSATNSPISLYPIPNSKHVMSYSQTGSTQYKYIYLYKNLPSQIQAVSGANKKTRYYQLTQPHDWLSNKVLLPDGSRAIVQDQSLTYSSDGRYMLANAGRAQTLIDTDTNTARLLGSNTNPSSGNPKVSLALSDSADSLFVADNNRGSYKIYNTQDCLPAANLSDPQVCASKDLSQFIRSTVPGIKTISRVKFLSDNKLELYIVHSTSEGYKSDRYIATAPGYTEPSLPYLALGDSFASGEGAQSYTSKSNNDNNRCHISQASYPYLIKRSLAYSQSESVACSGGKMKDVYEDRNKAYLLDSPQATDRLGPEYNNEVFANFLPGYRRQYEFVKQYKPDVATLSVGGNDINFGKKLQHCILSLSDCYQDADQKQSILSEIKQQFPKLVKTYTDLKTASPDTRIYVVGYPKLVLPDGNCALNVPLSSAELLLADEITEDLNTMIERATESAGVVYVDAATAFSGHRLCEDKSWRLAVNGLTFGTDQPYNIGPISSASFHPNVLGHQLFATTIATKTNNLTMPMPSADDSISVKNMPSRLNPSGVTVDSTKPILEDGLSDEFITTGDRLASSVRTSGYYLSTGSPYAVEIHSTPTQIGTATATDSETLSISAQVPEGIEQGSHELHIHGTDIAGEPIDIYKNVIVIANKTDYDGDGIDNATDQCTFVTPSGMDIDKDGIDDRCDLEIAAPAANDDDPDSDPRGDTPSESNPELPKSRSSRGLFGSIVVRLKQTVQKPPGLFGHQVSQIAKSKKVQKVTSKLAHNDWRKTVLILLTSTSLGVILIVLIDL